MAKSKRKVLVNDADTKTILRAMSEASATVSTTHADWNEYFSKAEAVLSRWMKKKDKCPSYERFPSRELARILNQFVKVVCPSVTCDFIFSPRGAITRIFIYIARLGLGPDLMSGMESSTSVTYDILFENTVACKCTIDFDTQTIKFVQR